MNNNTMNSAAVDQAARTLVHALASAIAANTDEALRHGYGDLLLVVTDFVTGRGSTQRQTSTPEPELPQTP